MEKVFDIQRVILEQFEEQPFYWRVIFDSIKQSQLITGIMGARGVGKTTLLLKLVLEAGAKKRQALYVSADNLFFLEHRLLDLVDYLYKETDVRFLCIDEIHKYPNWNQELKNIADTYPTFRILFSGSSMIDLVKGKYDLSRRVVLHHLHGFSFREYLEFQLGVALPTISLEELISSHISIASDLQVSQVLKHFNDYLRFGYYLYFQGIRQEREKFQTIENITQKTIYEDIGTLHALKTPSLLTIEQLYKFVINSSAGEVSPNKLARSLGKDYESVSTYLKYLQEAGLIRFIYPGNSGHAYLRNPAKMYPENSNLIFASYLPLVEQTAMGKVRETFVVNQVQNIGLPIFYSEKGDFKIDGTIFEVGGRNKDTKQIPHDGYVLADGVLTGSKRIIPLYLTGFLY